MTTEHKNNDNDYVSVWVSTIEKVSHKAQKVWRHRTQLGETDRHLANSNETRRNRSKPDETWREWAREECGRTRANASGRMPARECQRMRAKANDAKPCENLVSPGVRVCRHGLVDKAAEMDEAETDEQIRGFDGVRNIMQLFDDHCAPVQKISDHEDFERAVSGYERSSTETCTAYVAKKRELCQRHEKAFKGDCLPNLLKAKVMLRHSSLAAQKVENWQAGARDLTSVVQALCRLDTDVDVTSTFRQTTKTSNFKDGDVTG